MMRRVVVTGLGMVTPLACGVEETWTRLLAGQSGAGPITRFDASGVLTQYACEVKRGDGTDGTFNPDMWMEPKDQRKVDDFIVYAMTAATQAIQDAGVEPKTQEEQERTGVLIGEQGVERLRAAVSGGADDPLGRGARLFQVRRRLGERVGVHADGGGKVERAGWQLVVGKWGTEGVVADDDLGGCG